MNKCLECGKSTGAWDKVCTKCKGSKIDKDMLIERTRATIGFLNSGSGHRSKSMEMFAFLSVMHPEIPLAKRLRMAQEVKK